MVDAVLANLARTHTSPTADPGELDDWDLGGDDAMRPTVETQIIPGRRDLQREFGAIRVTRFDKDIDAMLDPFATFVVG